MPTNTCKKYYKNCVDEFNVQYRKIDEGFPEIEGICFKSEKETGESLARLKFSSMLQWANYMETDIK